MTAQYKIIITKQTIVDLESENEAKQVAELLAGREMAPNFAGHMVFISSDYELIKA
jgi:hypothetical protein